MRDGSVAWVWAAAGGASAFASGVAAAVALTRMSLYAPHWEAALGAALALALLAHVLLRESLRP